MKSHLLALSLLVFVFVNAAHAERPPQQREDAALIIEGEVEKVKHTESKFGNNGIRSDYVATIKLVKVEKGDHKVGEVIEVHWFNVTKRPTRAMPGAYGHAYTIKAKDEVKIWAVGEKGKRWEIIYNTNGIEKVTK
jgi:hypothetical protein